MTTDIMSTSLDLAELESIKKEIFDSNRIAHEEQDNILENANAFVQSVLILDLTNLPAKQISMGKFENIGMDLQRQAAQQIDLLKQPISTLSKRTADGGEVANALIDLKLTVEALDPATVELSPGWFSRLIGKIPGVGTPIKRYLSKYESAQTVIAAIIRSLELGRDQLNRDNLTLTAEQQTLWGTEQQLEKIILYALSVDKLLQKNCDLLKHEKPTAVKLIEEHMLFPVRQRVIDLQQQLAVQQQTVIATEIIIRNNKELMRGVNRALNVTICALQNATTIAMALAHQGMVLDKIEKVNATTSKLITDTAARLKTQGTMIHKGAASAQIDVNALKTALCDLNIALDEISTFRQKALPELASVIQNLDHLIKKTAKPLKQIKDGN